VGDGMSVVQSSTSAILGLTTTLVKSWCQCPPVARWYDGMIYTMILVGLLLVVGPVMAETRVEKVRRGQSLDLLWVNRSY